WRRLDRDTGSSPSVYAHPMDSTLKRAIEEYRAKNVDVSGSVVPDAGVAVPEDALALKRNVLAQALPNGQCHLPVQAGPCPHANACLTCGHFRSTVRFLPRPQAAIGRRRPHGGLGESERCPARAGDERARGGQPPQDDRGVGGWIQPDRSRPIAEGGVTAMVSTHTRNVAGMVEHRRNLAIAAR